MNDFSESDWKRLPRENALACNRQVLQQLRRAKGWTQAQLAEVAGYSERLISKAEAGEPISLATIDDLAEALSSENHRVYPEELVIDPLLKTREIILLLQHQRQAAMEHLETFLEDRVELRIGGHQKMKSCPPACFGKTDVMSVLKYLWMEIGGQPLLLRDIHCVGTGNEVSVWCKLVCEPDEGKHSNETEVAFRNGNIQNRHLSQINIHDGFTPDTERICDCCVQTCTLIQFRRGFISRIELMLDATAWRHLVAASTHR